MQMSQLEYYNTNLFVFTPSFCQLFKMQTTEGSNHPFGCCFYMITCVSVLCLR